MNQWSLLAQERYVIGGLSGEAAEAAREEIADSMHKRSESADDLTELGIVADVGHPSVAKSITDRKQQVATAIVTLIDLHLTGECARGFVAVSRWSTKVGVALQEALANALIHGSYCDPQERVEVSVKLEELCTETGRLVRVCITVTDFGEGFPTESVDDCTDDEGLRSTTGRGLALMEKFMNTEIISTGEGTTVVMEKEWPQEFDIEIVTFQEPESQEEKPGYQDPQPQMFDGVAAARVLEDSSVERS